MENRRLLEMCRGLVKAPGGQKTRYCQELMSELGITMAEINSVRLDDGGPDRNEVAELRKKTVKAVTSNLRLRVARLAEEKGVIEVGKPLPVVGFWKDGRILSRVGESGKFIIPQGQGRKGLTHVDPFSNEDFLKMLD